ncbi:unnamed protein product [Ilex paraguariensis]|uniref:Uncharacterized protein n=1 Tax=Ilex paraguariensis TaxID=185542 RepID=A0ABC8RVZ5_9AQUA
MPREQLFLESLLGTLNGKDEVASTAEAFLEANSGVEVCERMLKMWNRGRDGDMVDTSAEDMPREQLFLESLLGTLNGKDEVASTAEAFLEANSGVEVCERMLKMWNSLGPSTQKVLALAAEVKTLQKDREHLRINLHRAEDEVKALFEENRILDDENKRLMRQRHREKCTPGSGGKLTSSASAKSIKRKSSPGMSSPIEKKIDFRDGDSLRQPLSPLQHNSPECRMHKNSPRNSYLTCVLGMGFHPTEVFTSVKVLFEENRILDDENKRLMRQRHREKRTPGSGGKLTSSASAKSIKRKSSPGMSSPIEKKIDFSDGDSLRQPLSPLQHNSPECRMHKK